MNALFTIVAKNYLSFAITLADAVNKFNTGATFIIYVVDDIKEVPAPLFEKYTIRQVTSEQVPQLREMSFKYAITEFSTAVKPFLFRQLFVQEKYDKVIYVDPDIYFYSSPDNIFTLLGDKFCVLTPHITQAEESYTGNTPETELLYAGIYNLGFVALQNSVETNTLLAWWMNRLAHLCYADRADALHVDQKWMDFIPAFFGEKVLIYRLPDFNIAYWNIHEREITKEGGVAKISFKNAAATTYDICFMHFSGINPVNIYVNKQCRTLDIKNYPAWESLISDYANTVLQNGYKELLTLRYSFAQYDNGFSITALHRKLYRTLLELKKIDPARDPFAADKESYYATLEKYRLLAGKDKGTIDIADMGQESPVKKLTKIVFLLRVLKKLLGIKRYYTLCRAMNKILRPENQILLMEEYKKDFIDFYAKKYF